MKKILKRLIFLVILIYFITTVVSQQKTLNTYKTAEKEYQKQLDVANEEKEELEETKKNVSSLDYIEEVAREKLDMYLPNERVYVDIGK